MSKRIFTVGHSNHPINYFLELLTAHKINCVVDVRSIAASRFNPQYNGKALSQTLAQNQIQYVHFANEFGARQTDKTVLDENGQLDFGKVQGSLAFKAGVNRLGEGIKKNFKIALMCAEANPLDCHRFGMVSRYMANNGFEVQHILGDSAVLSNGEIEQQLLKKYQKKLSKPDMFGQEANLLDMAYKLLNKDIGFIAKGSH